MTINEFFLLILSIGVALIAITSVPVLLQLKSTSKKIESFLTDVEDDIKAMSKELTGAASSLQTLAATLNDKAQKTDRILETLGDSANTLKRSTDLLKDTVIPVVASAGGIRAGIKAFTYFLTKSYKT